MSVPTNLPFPPLLGSVDLTLTSELISNLISYKPEKKEVPEGPRRGVRQGPEPGGDEVGVGRRAAQGKAPEKGRDGGSEASNQ